jgi:hypothetical protein
MNVIENWSLKTLTPKSPKTGNPLGRAVVDMGANAPFGAVWPGKEGMMQKAAGLNHSE